MRLRRRDKAAEITPEEMTLLVNMQAFARQNKVDVVEVRESVVSGWQHKYIDGLGWTRELVSGAFPAEVLYHPNLPEPQPEGWPNAPTPRAK